MHPETPSAPLSEGFASGQILYWTWQRFAELGVDAHAASLEETNQYWQAELAIWPDLIRRLGLTSQ